MKNKAFIPKSRNINSKKDRKSFAELLGGRAVTRSMKKSDHDNDNQDHHQSSMKSKLSPPPSKKQKRGDNRTSSNQDLSSSKMFTQNINNEGEEKNMVNPKNVESIEGDDMSFKEQYDKMKAQSDGDTFAPILPYAVFLIDDSFSNETSLQKDSKDSMKNLNNEFLRRLSFIKEMFCEKSHLLR